MELTAEMFKAETREAVRAFDKYVICLEKSPEECETVIQSLVKKAIHAYETRASGLRHGIALDKQVTVILSQTDGPVPLCSIYFNLSSPYHKKPAEAAGEARG